MTTEHPRNLPDGKTYREEADDSMTALTCGGCFSVIVLGGIIAAIVWAGGFWTLFKIAVVLIVISIVGWAAVTIGNGFLRGWDNKWKSR